MQHLKLPCQSCCNAFPAFFLSQAGVPDLATDSVSNPPLLCRLEKNDTMDGIIGSLPIGPSETIKELPKLLDNAWDSARRRTTGSHLANRTRRSGPYFTTEAASQPTWILQRQLGKPAPFVSGRRSLGVKTPSLPFSKSHHMKGTGSEGHTMPLRLLLACGQWLLQLGECKVDTPPRCDM